jgi:hypothetical protein
MYGEFLISPNVSITVESGAQLFIIGAHLYGCQAMWEGIRVKDGGRIVMHEYNGRDNLIEDAKIAVSANGYTSATNPMMTIRNTTFNRNYISVELQDFPISNSSQSTAVNFHSCVFTSRNLTFTPTWWPQTSTSDLRSSVSGTNVLFSPYELQNSQVLMLKPPHSTQPAHTAIRLKNVGTTSGATNPFNFNSVVIGSTLFPSYFLLFDAHCNSVDIENSNVTVHNSVFQNSQLHTITNTITNIPKDFFYPVIRNQDLLQNTQLSLTGANNALSSRFYDCHWPVISHGGYNLEISNTIIRSTLSPTVTAIYRRGMFGIAVWGNSNNIIENNELTNVEVGIQCSSGYGTSNNVSIKQNTISSTLNTSFTGTTTNFVRSALSVGGAGGSTPGSSIEVEDNILYRVQRGIFFTGLNSVEERRKIIARNRITLEEDDAPGQVLQWGIMFNGNKGGNPSVPSNSLNCLNSIEENTVTVLAAGSVTNTNIRLIDLAHNTGGTMPSPYVICNVLSNGFTGFRFTGWNGSTYWRGNTMQNIGRGLELAAGGVIGQQGSTGAPSDNQWLGNWSGNSGTYVNSSNASSSVLYINPSNGSAYSPPSNGGNFAFNTWYSWPGNTVSTSGIYNCLAPYSPITPPMPAAENYFSEKHLYLARTLLFRYLYDYPDLKNASAALRDFYEEFDTTNIRNLADVNAFLIANDLTAAQDLMASLSNLNETEQHWAEYYSLYIRYRNNDFAETDESDEVLLLSLCGLCPEDDGPLVYDAWNLHLSVKGKIFLAGPGCGRYGGKASTVQSDNSEQRHEKNDAWLLHAYPNPASRELTFVSSRSEETLTVRISDLSGRCLAAMQLDIANSRGNLSLSLENGIYLVSANNGSDPARLFKLVVTK